VKIIRFSVEHPAIVIVLVPAVLLAGILAFTSLTRELLPDVNMPSISVITLYPGAGVGETEKQITEVLEKELALLSDLTSLQSRTGPGRSTITCNFTWESDLEEKKQEVRELIDRALPELPDNLPRAPMIRLFGAESIPVMTILVDGDQSPIVLGTIVETTLVPMLSRVPGVSAVSTRGLREEELFVKIDPPRAWYYSVSVPSIVEAVRRSGMTIPAGSVDLGFGEAPLAAKSSFATIDEVGSLVVSYRGPGLVHLSDIAELSFEEKKPEVEVWSEGNRQIGLDIYKRRGADTIAIAGEIDAILKDTASLATADLRFTVTRDQREEISQAISSVAGSAVAGALLAILILFFFLHRIRGTLIVCLSIPLSVLLTFCALLLSGGSLNVTTLGGIAVSLGMIVDAAIVVLESIHRRLDDGMEPEEAAVKGASEVAGAVTASILTSLAVFVPLIFLPGFAGIVLRDISSTIVFALPASLLVALTVIPSFVALSYRRGYEKGKGERSGRIMELFSRWYRYLVLQVLDHPRFFVALALSVLVVSLALYPRLGFDFIPEVDVDELILQADLPPGMVRREAVEMVRQAEKVLKENLPELKTSLFFLGERIDGVLLFDSERPRSRNIFRITEEAAEALSLQVPDMQANLFAGGLSLMGRQAAGGGFSIDLRGPGMEMEEIYGAAVMLGERISALPAVSSVFFNTSMGKPVVDLLIDGELLEKSGLPAQAAMATARIFFARIDGGSVNLGGKDWDITISGGLGDEQFDPKVLDILSLPLPSGGALPFSSFSGFSEKRGLSIHPREDRVRGIRMEAILQPGTLRSVQEESLSILARLEQDGSFPANLQWEMKGISSTISDSFSSLAAALIAAVILVYIVLVIQFERFTLPLLIMTAVPFIMTGVMPALLFFGSALSVVSFLGIIALAGIVVNNAIVMVDAIQNSRGRGRALNEAILEGAEQRLKPVLMTTFTTILGLAPLAFGISPVPGVSGRSSALLAPLGQTIMGGLGASTMVTLLLIPALYLLWNPHGDAPSPEKPGDTVQ
jgi:hydrophobic/amphiphilic exporter-1 (mainly G- bacteria), HAE1 family